LKHASREQLESFVMGIATDDEADLLRAHVASCPKCALLLRREAQLEIALHEGMKDAAEPVQAPSLPRSWVPEGIGIAALVLLCAAAAWTQWRDRWHHRAPDLGRTASLPRIVSSAEDPWRTAPGYLVESPREVGLTVQVPLPGSSSIDAGVAESLQ
jgi:putative zinc finger protein